MAADVDRRTGAPRATAARRLALKVLYEIEAEGAFANLAVDRALSKSELTGPDRSLFTALVYGVTKWSLRLDHVLSRLSNTPVDRLPERIRIALRIGLYQLMFMDRVPARAAVAESVALAREFGHRGTAGLVNAVLRRAAAGVSEGDPVAGPDRDPAGADRDPTGAGEDPAGTIAVAWSHPPWLVRRWLERFGPAETVRLCRVNNEEAPLTLRVNLLRTSREGLITRLRDAGVEARPGRIFPEALHVETVASLRGLSAYGEGLFSVQDESSMAAARAVDPGGLRLIVDMCAGVGGKATHLAELAGDRGRVVAVDLHEHKLRLLKATAARLGLRSIDTIKIDARRLPLSDLAGSADAVLVDAPCSGTGALRRRPDLRWRIDEAAIGALAGLQGELLEAAAGCVRPGGVVVYATCSIEPEENQQVVEGFLSRRREFEADGLESGVRWAGVEPDIVEVEDGRLSFRSTSGGPDGFFIARLVRKM